MPDRFLRQVAALRAAAGRRVRRRAGLPARPTRPRALSCEALVERIAAEEGQRVLGWRPVPTNLDAVGAERRRGRAGLRAGVRRPRPPALRRRPDASRALRAHALRHPQARSSTTPDPAAAGRRRRKAFYIVSLSANTLIYKGMLTASQIEAHVSRSVRSRRSSRRWRWCTSASRPTRSRRGRWRIPTATSRTTARSTRCAATSTGCARARACCSRACSATTCARCCR